MKATHAFAGGFRFVVSGMAVMLLAATCLYAAPPTSSPSTRPLEAVEEWAKTLDAGAAERLMAAFEARINTIDAAYVFRPHGSNERWVDLLWDRPKRNISATIVETSVPDAKKVVTKLVRNGVWQWEARPEEVAGAPGSWTVSQTPRREADADEQRLYYLDQVVFRLKDLAACFTPLHRWDQREKLGDTQLKLRYESTEVLQGLPEAGNPERADRPEARMTWGVYDGDERVGEYFYEVAVTGGFRVLSCSLRGPINGKVFEEEHFDYLRQKNLDGVWVPMLCRYKTMTTDGDLGGSFELEFTRLAVNKPIPPERFDYAPPFGSRVHVKGGEGNRVGYVDPRSPPGRDANDGRLEPASRPAK